MQPFEYGCAIEIAAILNHPTCHVVLYRLDFAWDYRKEKVPFQEVTAILENKRMIIGSFMQYMLSVTVLFIGSELCVYRQIPL